MPWPHISLICIIINMKSFSIKNNEGYSLVEMVIYIALLAILMIVVVHAVLSIITSYRNIKAVRDLESTAILSMDRMTRTIRNGTRIDMANSTFGANPGILTIDTGTTTDKFYVSGGELQLDENGAYLGRLSLGDTTIKNLIFRLISTSTSEAVKIELEITSGTGSFSQDFKFYDTAIVRGSYQ